MAFLGNLIWFIFGGWAVGMMYLIGAIFLFPLLPFLLPLVGYSFWPFGRQPVSKSAINAYKAANNMEIDEDGFAKASKIVKILANSIWFVFGLILAIIHIISGILNLCLVITIVFAPLGIANGLAHFKMVRVALFPFGVKLVSTDLAKEMLKEKAKSKL
tara:strand:+ start:890 stop:1366 length:477 start_codon:yes stop_codon:yes gene_type:complete